MDIKECKSALSVLSSNLSQVSPYDLTEKKTQIFIAEAFWQAAQKLTLPEHKKLKEWLRDCSGALEWHGRFSDKPNLYKSFFSKNFYILNKVIQNNA